MGKMAKRKELDDSKLKNFDDYTNQIQLTEGLKVDHQRTLANALGNDYFEKAEIDRILEQMNQEESEIQDADWVREQKKKFQFQQ